VAQTASQAVVYAKGLITNGLGDVYQYNVWLHGLCAGLWFRLLCLCTQLGSTTDGTTTIRLAGYITTHCMIYHPFHCNSSNSEGSQKLSDDDRLLSKHVGAGL
jgi:hypothetical protein